jgi:hypothetical protein
MEKAIYFVIGFLVDLRLLLNKKAFYDLFFGLFTLGEASTCDFKPLESY